MPPQLPLQLRSLDDLQALAAAATVHHTPCGDGPLVWHQWGDPAHPPVVLLHGGSGSWTHWARNVAARVAAGQSVWVPDLPGFGDSALPEGCTDADHQLPWLQAGLRQLLGERPAHLVAFSFGSLPATLLACDEPARVASLLLVGAPALSDERLPPLPLRVWDFAPEGPRRDAIHRHNLLTLMLAHDASVDELSIRVHAANLVRDRMRRRRLMLTDLIAQRLPEVRCRVGGLWGSEDALYRMRLPIIEPVLARAPRFDGLALLPGVGHWVMWEDAAASDRVLDAWLRGAPIGR